MKRQWSVLLFVLLLVGCVLLGALGGFRLARRVLAPRQEPSTTVLSEFNCWDVLMKDRKHAWQVHTPVPGTAHGAAFPLGPWKGWHSVSRGQRYVAETEMSTGESWLQERREFFEWFLGTVHENIAEKGAELGPYVHNSEIPRAGRHGSYLRYYSQHYSRGGVNGVVHIVLVGHGDKVTLFFTADEALWYSIGEAGD